MKNFEDILSELSLEELSEVTKTALSLIYQKLRSEEGFGHDQHCLVTSIGDRYSYVDACIVDADGGRSNGTHYDGVYWL